MTTPFLTNIPKPRITFNTDHTDTNLATITCDYTDTIRAIQKQLAKKSETEILEFLIPQIAPALRRAGWTPPPAPQPATYLDN